MHLNHQSAGLKSADLKADFKKLQPYLAELLKISHDRGAAVPECFINVPGQTQALDRVSKLRAEKVNKDLKYVIVIGIGGANLGAKAIYDAFYGAFASFEDRFPKFIFLDTCDPEILSKVTIICKKISRPEEVLISLVSKSGTTTESMANSDLVWQALSSLGHKLRERVVVVTDRGTPLWKICQANNFDCLEHVGSLGGRFSSLSAVGFFPLAVAGIDVKSWLAGAGEATIDCLEDDLRNPAVVLASAIYRNYQKGRLIQDFFFFHPELESLGKWCRQLYAESLGKEEDLSGKKIKLGVLPTVTIGSTDLHSMGQAYLAGPANRMTFFVSAKSRTDLFVGQSMFSGIVKGLPGQTAGQVMAAILSGTQKAYQKVKLPFAEIQLNDITPAELGYFMQFQMMTTILIAKLFNVNAFDQPQVELYKEETRQILQIVEKLD